MGSIFAQKNRKLEIKQLPVAESAKKHFTVFRCIIL